MYSSISFVELKCFEFPCRKIKRINLLNYMYLFASKINSNRNHFCFGISGHNYNIFFQNFPIINDMIFMRRIYNKTIGLLYITK